MNLPQELLDRTCEYLDLPDLKDCRLVNQQFERAATQLVFETVHLSFTDHGVLTFEAIGNSKGLTQHARTIILRGDSQRECPAFPSQESWERNVRCDSERWANMDFAERTALYNEYEMDRTRPLSKNDKFLQRVVRSMENMHNLTTFYHEPTKYDEMAWKHEWRELCFPGYDNSDYSDDNLDEQSLAYSEEIEHDIDSLHTALFLEALGSIQPRRSLETIAFNIQGPAFWTPVRLRHLWQEHGHGTIRQLRKSFGNAAMADKLANEGVSDTEIENYSTRLHNLQSVFGRVESIDLNVIESYSNGNLDTIAEPLSSFLRLGKSLRDVTLAFGNFGPYYDPRYLELLDYRENRRDLLGQLAVDTPWPAIVTLQISIATDSSTFLGFLRTIASTLRNLWLDSVILLPGDTWEAVLPCVSNCLPLVQTLDMDNLYDFRTDTSTRKLFSSSDWKCGECYEEYKHTIQMDLVCRRKLQHVLEMHASPNCEHSQIAS